MGETCPKCHLPIGTGYGTCNPSRPSVCKNATAAYERGRRDAAPRWQPMETAPRDGTRILVAFEDGMVVIWAWPNQGPHRRVIGWMPLPDWTETDRGRGDAMTNRFPNGNLIIGHECRCEYCGETLEPDAQAERERLIGANVLAALSDLGWDHATVRADVESERLAETCEGLVMLAIERGMRGQVMK